MSTEPQATPQTPDKAGTEYVVLAQFNAPDGHGEAREAWSEEDRVTASSADAAMRKVAETFAEQGTHTLIAIPTRSFVPTKVTVETTKTVRLG